MNAFKSYFSPSSDPAPGRKQVSRPGAHDLQPPPGPNSDESRWSSSTAGGGHGGNAGLQAGGRPPPGDRNSGMSLAPHQPGLNRASFASMTDLKADVTVSCLYQDLLKKLYAQDWNISEGVVLKKSKDNYVCAPPQMREIPYGFYEMIGKLNVAVAVTVNTPVVQSIIGAIMARPFIDAIPLPDNLQLQVLRRVTDLPRCKKHHFAAFILQPPILAVWDDDPNHILERVETLEQDIIRMIWRGGDEDEEEEE